MTNSILGDIRYAARLILRSPGYALTVIAVLGLGISANAAVFTIFKSAFLTPLPGVNAPSQLAVLVARTNDNRSVNLSYPDYKHIREANTAFSGLMASSPGPLTIGGDQGALRVWGELVSGNYFQVLGVEARLGRMLLPSDEHSPGREAVAVISEGLWQRAFGGRSDVVGNTILVNGQPLTVVGVAESGFHGSVLSMLLDVFIPLTMQPRLHPSNHLDAADTTRWLIPMGRLKPGASVAEAAAEIGVFGKRLAADDAADAVGQQMTVLPLWQSPFGAQTYLLPVVAILTITGVLVLLIVCTNLANLALARGLTRRPEVATRLAMGASRSRVVRLLILENALLAVPAAVVGLVLAPRLFGLFGGASAPTAMSIPTQFETPTDSLVIAFAFVVSCAGALAFSVVPAFRGSRVSLVSAMRGTAAQSGAAPARLRAAILIVQVAASLLLLVAAALTVRTVEAARSADLGFDPGGVVSVRIDLSTSGYDEPRGQLFYEQLTDRLQNSPGVESASLADFVPMRIVSGRSRQVAVEGYAAARDENMRVPDNIVGPEYFRTLRIGIVAGRAFDETVDGAEGSRVVIVNETTARRFWGASEEALGKRIRVGGDEGNWRTVVGVVRDLKYLQLNEGPTSYFYIPSAQDYRPEMTLHVRGSLPTADLIARVRSEIRALDSSVPVLDAQSLADQARSGLAFYELASSALVVFGLIAIALAAVGVYGLVSYAVKQRTHEIGIRMAVGAERASVVRGFMMTGVRLGVIGAAIGIVVAMMVTRFMVAVLYGVHALDAVAFGAAAALVLVVSGFASLVPAWRAASIDPISALRHP